MSHLQLHGADVWSSGTHRRWSLEGPPTSARSNRHRTETDGGDFSVRHRLLHPFPAYLSDSAREQSITRWGGQRAGHSAPHPKLATTDAPCIVRRIMVRSHIERLRYRRSQNRIQQGRGSTQGSCVWRGGQAQAPWTSEHWGPSASLLKESLGVSR